MNCLLHVFRKEFSVGFCAVDSNRLSLLGIYWKASHGAGLLEGGGDERDE